LHAGAAEDEAIAVLDAILLGALLLGVDVTATELVSKDLLIVELHVTSGTTLKLGTAM